MLNPQFSSLATNSRVLAFLFLNQIPRLSRLKRRHSSLSALTELRRRQLQNIRRGLRGDSVVLMGKNTMMRRSIRKHSEMTGNQAYLNLIPLLQGNVGLIFTKGDLKEVSEEVSKYKALKWI